MSVSILAYYIVILLLAMSALALEFLQRGDRASLVQYIIWVFLSLGKAMSLLLDLAAMALWLVLLQGAPKEAASAFVAPVIVNAALAGVSLAFLIPTAHITRVLRRRTDYEVVASNEPAAELN